MMRYAKIRRMDVSNGPGLRVSLFTQGCDIRCKWCFNKSTWAFDGGILWTCKVQEKVLSLCNNEHISGLSILGGEPLYKDNIPALEELCSNFRALYPNKSIWLWTGHTIDYINENWALYRDLFKFVDVVVVNPFYEAKKDPKLAFRGSSNQKIYEVNVVEETFTDVSNVYDNEGKV